MGAELSAASGYRKSYADIQPIPEDATRVDHTRRRVTGERLRRPSGRPEQVQAHYGPLERPDCNPTLEPGNEFSCRVAGMRDRCNAEHLR